MELDRSKVSQPDERDHLEEVELLRLAQSGSADAFEALVNRYAQRLYASVHRFLPDRQDADEVVQETFLRAWRSIGRFKGNSAFFTWLYRIGINEAKRLGERRLAKPTVSLDAERNEAAGPWSQSPESRARTAELRELLRHEILDLPFEYRAPLVLRDVEGRSVAEGAELMNLSVPAFKSRLHRARLTLRERLSDQVDGAHGRREEDDS